MKFSTVVILPAGNCGGSSKDVFPGIHEASSKEALYRYEGTAAEKVLCKSGKPCADKSGLGEWTGVHNDSEEGLLQ